MNDKQERVESAQVNERLLEALKVARITIINDAFPIGWSVDRLGEVIAAAEAQQADQQAEPVAWDSIEAIATNRYKVVPSHKSMFHRFAVVAGDGWQQLYLGREVECATMAIRFAGAFLDGAFAYQKILATAQQPAQQQAEPVAAQCRFEGEEEWKPCTVAHHLLVQAHPKEWPHYETRALYAQPQAVAAQPVQGGEA